MPCKAHCWLTAMTSRCSTAWSDRCWRRPGSTGARWAALTASRALLSHCIKHCGSHSVTLCQHSFTTYQHSIALHQHSINSLSHTINSAVTLHQLFITLLQLFITLHQISIKLPYTPSTLCHTPSNCITGSQAMSGFYI
jgi:hypothetical protein